MTAAEDLRLLIDGYTLMVSNLDTMLTRLDEELASLAAEISTITDGAMDGAMTSHLARLEAKRVALGHISVSTWGTYGTDNISDDWGILGYDENPWTGDITRLGNDSFKHEGMSFPLYDAGRAIKCNGVPRVVDSVDYDAPIPGPDPPASPGSIIVYLTAGTALPIPLTSIYNSSVRYSYEGNGWDSDAGIIFDQFAFALGYDEIHAPIDLNGTYGLLARSANITTGRGVQVLNRNKYQEFVTYYEPYAAP